jgi:hypothetical protein
MNTGKKYSKMLFLVLLLVAFATGCGKSHTNNVPPNSNKAITAFSLNGASGAINEAAKTIAVTMPFSTPSVTALVATFSTTGKNVLVGATTQISGTTPNNFTNPVLYTVTATDGSAVNYTVTVTVAPSFAKAITAYSLAGQLTSTIIGTAITVTMPFSTPSVTALVATFSTSGAFVTVGTTTQTSTTTPNNFTSPVTYTVHAADATTQTYTVTVAVMTLPAPVNLGVAGNFVILTTTGITNVPTSTIDGTIGSSPITAAAMNTVLCSEVTGSIYGVDAAYTGDGIDVTCFVPGTTGGIPNTDKIFVDTAVLNMGTAYTDAAGRAAGVTELGAGDISGMTLAAGVYKWGTGVVINSDVTLNGSATDVWIFQIAQGITQASATSVNLTGGALAKNVFWQAFGVVALDTTAHMEGVILSSTAITLNTGATVTGRLLAGTAVTLQQNTVSQPAP